LERKKTEIEFIINMVNPALKRLAKNSFTKINLSFIFNLEFNIR
jgi:hypothetical protein